MAEEEEEGLEGTAEGNEEEVSMKEGGGERGRERRASGRGRRGRGGRERG